MNNFIRNHKNEIIFLSGLLIIFIIADFYDFTQDSNLLKVVFLNIGQGDASFIETPSHKQILIDAGPNNIILSKLGKFMPFYDRYIDVVMASHLDSDHIGGLIDVLKRYKVGVLIINMNSINKSLYLTELEKIIENKKIQKIDLFKNSEILVEPNLVFNILNPDINEKQVSDNDGSLVVRLVFGKISFIFTSDISQNRERKLLAENLQVDSDVLKAAHHGSKNSSSDDFLAAVSPLISVISVGVNNKYGHPNLETLNRLKNSEILRTDLDGDIEILSNGLKIWKK